MVLPGPFSSNAFPDASLVPKHETQAIQFLQKYPQWDGRGVKVAILDTGVDPAAPGMQTTTDGQPKMADLIDCNGSGDVDMSKVVHADESDGNLVVEGLTGRRIQLNRSWSNPSGEWRTGFLKIWDLFPESLVKRLQNERKEAFIVENQQLISKAQRELDEFVAPRQPLNSLSKADILKKEELSARVKSLIDMQSDYNDVGPLADIISFHNGETWQAVIDKDESGDLSSRTAMSTYKLNQQYDYFSEQDLMTYSFNFYEDGNVLSVVTTSGSHGTHVAGIVGAHFENNPDLNGSAPGCQLISMKIGDQRLASLETGQGLVRACSAIVEHGVDIVNISFGEDAALPNAGKIIDSLKEIIYKHNVVVVSSAGNEGSVLSSVGAPGGTTSGIISVGAFVSGRMMTAEYSMLEAVRDGPYTWSSRGPAYDGAKGVTIFSPGGAITSVPRYCLQHAQLMNGTSMSSPSACGGISLVLSALKGNNMPFSAHRIRKAVEFSARSIDDPSEVGMLQVESAYELIMEHQKLLDQDVDFQVSLTDGPNQMRGIYLRQADQIETTSTKSVNIKPWLKEDDTVLKNQIDLRVNLVSSVPWVKCPEFLLLGFQGRNFDVQVHPQNLSEGWHYGSINGYDANTPGRQLFSVPVTVTKPIVPKTNTVEWTEDFGPGRIVRKFLSVPQGCSWVNVKIESQGHEEPIRMMIHSHQVRPQARKSWTSFEALASLVAGESWKKSIEVEPGFTAELDFSQWWASLGEMRAKISIEFHGLHVEHGSLDLMAGSTHKMLVSSSIQSEQIKADLKFDRKRQLLRPTKSRIYPLGSRDVLPSGLQLFALELQYTFDHADGEMQYEFPSSQFLYDSPYHSGTSMLLDSRGKRVYFGDFYPRKTKLPKGSYTIRAQFVHESSKKLKDLENMLATVDTYLEKGKEISLSPFDDHIAIIDGEASALRGKLPKGYTKVLAFNPDVSEPPAPLLVGTFKLGEKSYSASLRAGPAVKTAEDDEDKKAPRLLDLQIDMYKKVSDESQKAELKERLLRENPHDVALLSVLLDQAKGDIERNQLADQLIEQIDMAALEQSLGQLKVAYPDKAEREAQLHVEELKSALISALQFKSSRDEDCYESLRRLQKPKDNPKTALCTVEHEFQNGRYGLALLAINEYIGANKTANDDTAKSIRKYSSQCFEKLGWNLWEKQDQKMKLVDTPVSKYVF